MLQAAPAANILPDTAEATVNAGFCPTRKHDSHPWRARDGIGDPEVEVRALNDPQFAPVSPINGEVTDRQSRRSSGSQGGRRPVVQSMGTGGTDSRWLRPLGVKAYGIGRLPVTPQERRQGHWAHRMP
jgi:acetylornithine deacetylase/succinyl-diaminopimelate desuccinylase-like protein